MSYFSQEGVVERAEDNRLTEIQDSLGQGNFPDGANKEVFLTSRNTVGKIDQFTGYPAGASSDTDDLEKFPWAVMDVKDLSNIGLQNETALVEMRKADMSHKEAVDTFGLLEVIERDLDMFFGILEEGKVYRDFKHQNIGYFNKDQWRPEPVDIFDQDAIEPYQNNPEQLARSLGLYLRGNKAYNGIVDEYDITLNRAERKVFDYMGLEKSKMERKPFKDILRELNNT